MINSIMNFFTAKHGKCDPPRELFYVPSYRELMTEDNLFFENPYVRRSVTVLANAVCGLQFELVDKNKKKACGKLRELFEQPSSGVSWKGFIEGLITNYLIYGNAYVLLNRVEDRWQIYNLYSSNMNVIRENGTVIYRYNGKDYSNKLLPYIGHFKTFNPRDAFKGISPLEAARVSASLHQNIELHNLAIIQNGGRVSGVIHLKNGGALTKEQQEAIRRDLIENYKGPDNAGKIAVVTGDFEWKPMGVTNEAMDYADAAKRAVRAIGTSLGVPGFMLGEASEGESARANLGIIMENFNNNTVLPLVGKMVEFLNNLFSKVDSSAKIVIVNDEISKQLYAEFEHAMENNEGKND